MMNRRSLILSRITGNLASRIGDGVDIADVDETIGAASKTFMSRLSAILQIDASRLNKALHQAKRDAQDISGERLLDGMFERGRISRTLADRCLGWFQSRPLGFPFGRRALVMREQVILLRVDRMLQLGLISQDSADQFLDWFHARPAGLPHGKQPAGRIAKSSSSGFWEISAMKAAAA